MTAVILTLAGMAGLLVAAIVVAVIAVAAMETLF